MSYGRANQAEMYRQVDKQTAVESASAHRLIQMLFNGALEKLTIAKGHLDREKYGSYGESIGLAIAIIDGLRASLDFDAGGDIAKNLDALYEYMNGVLLQANLHRDVRGVNEVMQLLNEIKSGWDGIANES